MRAHRRRAAPLDTPMRLASVTKPFTAAAVRELVARGDLALSTRVFAYLGTWWDDFPSQLDAAIVASPLRP